MTDKEHPLSLVNRKQSEITELIGRTSIINDDDIKALDEVKNFAVSTYTDVPGGSRPLVVKLATVLNDAQFPTADKKYWQCKSEAEVHFNQIVKESNKFERAVIDVEEIDYKIKQLEGEIERLRAKNIEPKSVLDDGENDPNLLEFQLRRLISKRKDYIFEIKQLEKTIKHRIKEVSEWNMISQQLEEKCEFSTTDFEEHVAKDQFLKLSIQSQDTNFKGREQASQHLATLKRILSQMNKDID